MTNPTVRGNLKLIEELQENQGMLIAWAQDSIEKLQADEAFIADLLDRVLTLMKDDKLSSQMFTYRAKWKETQNKLKEIANAKNTEG